MLASHPLPRRALAIVALASLSWLAFTAFDPGATVGQEPAGNVQAGLEVLGHGPVHEAFAQPATDKVEVEVSFKKAPPQPIEELPPDVKPEGDNVQWIPGYWAFDTERDDFIWVSGFWRNVPPGRVWVPGYWTAANGESRWVSGYWTEAGQNQVQYYPPPPEPIVEVPPPPLDSDSIYVSGMWLYRENRYAWRPGYWAPYRQGYLWTAPRYSWTPAGYVFVNGYWDYDFGNRGTLFAPVAFGPQYFASNRYYAPQYVISMQPFFGALFVQPRYGHYYFGDYYAPRYAQLGYTPWYNYRANARYPDPTFAYYSARHRGDARWADNMRESYAARQSGKAAAPSRRFDPAQAPAGGNVANPNANLVVSLNQAEKNPALGLKRITKDEANAQRTRAADTRALIEARQKNEKKLQGEGPRQQPAQAQLPLPALAGGVGVKQAGQLPPIPKEPPVSQKFPQPKNTEKVPAVQVEQPKGNPKGKETDAPMPKAVTPPKDPQVQPPGEPTPQPKVPPPQPKPPVDPQPKVQPPQPKSPIDPQPKVPPPQPQPVPQPKVAPPQPKLDPPPVPITQPAPQPIPQPKVAPPQPKAAPQPIPQPAPQPKVAPPQPKAAPQPPPQQRPPAPNPPEAQPRNPPPGPGPVQGGQKKGKD